VRKGERGAAGLVGTTAEIDPGFGATGRGLERFNFQIKAVVAAEVLRAALAAPIPAVPRTAT
jgi:hypothetical protein